MWPILLKRNLLGFGIFCVLVGVIGWLSAKLVIPDYSNDRFLIGVFVMALVSNFGLMGKFAFSLTRTKRKSFLLFSLMFLGATALWWGIGVFVGTLAFFGSGATLR